MTEYIEINFNDLIDKYGIESIKRKELCSTLSKYIEQLLLNGVEALFIGGSFITDKIAPNDIDVVLKISETISEDQSTYLIHLKEELKIKGIDIILAFSDELLEYNLHFFSLDRLGNKTDVIKILTTKVLYEPLPFLQDYIYIERLKEAERLLQKSNDQTISTAIQKYIVELKKEFEKKSVAKFYSQCLEVEVSMPAEHGKADIQTNSLIGLLLEKKERFTVLDFGCGQGRLIATLLSLDKSVLKNLTYVGADFDFSRAKNYSTENNFDKYCNSVKFINFDELTQFQKEFDYIISINVLHEVPANELYKVLILPLDCLKDNGVYTIHDMEKLPFGESSFVPWESTYFSNMINDLKIHSTIRKHTTKSGVPIFSILLKRPNEKINVIDFNKILLKTYNNLMRHYIEKRKDSNISSKEYGYYSVVIANGMENKYLLEQHL